MCCKIKEKIARYDTDLFFNFQIKNSSKESFRMVCFLTCYKSNELVDELQPSSKFIGREKIKRYFKSSELRGEPLVITG